jgi:hypothetical protein
LELTAKELVTGLAAGGNDGVNGSGNALGDTGGGHVAGIVSHATLAGDRKALELALGRLEGYSTQLG